VTRHRSRSYPRRLELLLDEELLLDDEEEELELPVDEELLDDEELEAEELLDEALLDEELEDEELLEEELLDDDSLDELLLDELVRMPVGSVGDPPHAVMPPTVTAPASSRRNSRRACLVSGSPGESAGGMSSSRKSDTAITPRN
jgi:hypothetical protein